MPPPYMMGFWSTPQCIQLSSSKYIAWSQPQRPSWRPPEPKSPPHGGFGGVFSLFIIIATKPNARFYKPNLIQYGNIFKISATTQNILINTLRLLTLQ